MGNVLVAILSTFSEEDREQKCIKVAASIEQFFKKKIGLISIGKLIEVLI